MRLDGIMLEDHGAEKRLGSRDSHGEDHLSGIMDAESEWMIVGHTN